jgi:hypothetical protein
MILAAALALAVAAEPHPWDRAAEASARNLAEEGRIVVRLGERVIVAFDEDLDPRVEAVEPSDVSIADTPRPVRDGAMAFSLIHDDAAGWVLKAENGLKTSMAYGAMIGHPIDENMGLAPSSTCSIAPRIVGIEQWRYEVVMVALGPFQTRPDGPGRCETLAPPPRNVQPSVPAPRKGQAVG